MGENLTFKVTANEIQSCSYLVVKRHFPIEGRNSDKLPSCQLACKASVLDLAIKVFREDVRNKLVAIVDPKGQSTR